MARRRYMKRNSYFTTTCALVLGLVIGSPMARAQDKPTNYRVVDPSDVYVSPNKYKDKPIELRDMRCLHADEDEYRCIAPGGTTLVVFSSAVEPEGEKGSDGR